MPGARCSAISTTFATRPALELADNLGLSHARVAIDQQTGHPVTGWVGQQVFQARERQASLIEADPAVGPDPGDTLVIREPRELPIRRIEMRAPPCPAHDHSSTSNVGTSRMSQASA